MRSLRDLALNRLVLPPDVSVASALLAMQRAGQASAAILQNDEFRGFVTIEACVLSDPLSPVTEIMRGAYHRFDASEKVRAAAKTFVRQQADVLPVFDGPTFVGLLPALLIISELGRSWDPLTGLSWSDRLRDWGVDCLESGQEITILFFDLNDFGAYNKQYGHTVGDAVIRGFAAILNDLIDPQRDVLVRYGGDEFAIGTTRTRQEAEALLQLLEPREFHVKGVPAPVTFSYGVSGGKRTHEPSRDHVAATLDNLINLASKDCLAHKPRTSTQAAGVEQPLPRQLELDVRVEPSSPETGERILVHVRDHRGKALGESSTVDSRFYGVAEAALSALHRLDSTLQLTVESIAFTFRDGQRFVEIWGRTITGTESEHYHVRHLLNGNPDSSVAKAVVKAYSQAALLEQDRP